MDKRVILAVAGAGKTYTICEKIDVNKKNLILAFTNENIKNIKKEMNKMYGYIPELTTIMTFDSFKYRYILCPYEPTILKHFNEDHFIKRGITLSNPPQRTITVNGKTIPNKDYCKKENFNHYINSKNKYYCANLSELFLQVRDNEQQIIRRISKNINDFFDCVMIDEFQDFRKHDFELITQLAKNLDNVTLVGDYYQHSVSGKNNSGKPFKNKSKFITYDEFVSVLKKNKFLVDEVSLSGSRRCPKSICDFVRGKLNINIFANNNNTGNVIWVDENKAKEVMENNSITKLVYENSKEYSFNAINWSYSKGDTISDVCVILIPSLDNIDNEIFDISVISQITINKLYVALTRTDKNLYLMKSSIFDSVKSKYIIN